MQIAIDGPAGVGKSTVSKQLAKDLGFLYLDTGAMYRAITFKALKENDFETLDKEQNKLIEEIAENSSIDFDKNRIFIDGEEITEEIRSRDVSANVSFVAANKKVRQELTKQQRKIAEGQSVVLDGRDIGTAVLPKADVKFYLDATARCRAIRRAKDYKLDLSDTEALDKLEKEIIERDYKDSHREESPLMKAPDAIVIETDTLTPQEVLEIMLQKINS